MAYGDWMRLQQMAVVYLDEVNGGWRSGGWQEQMAIVIVIDGWFFYSFFKGFVVTFKARLVHNCNFN